MGGQGIHVLAQHLLIAVPDFELVGQVGVAGRHVIPRCTRRRNRAATQIRVHLIQCLARVLGIILTALVRIKVRLTVKRPPTHGYVRIAQQVRGVDGFMHDHVGV